MATCDPVRVIKYFYELRISDTELDVLRQCLQSPETKIADEDMRRQLYALLCNAKNGAYPTITRSE